VRQCVDRAADIAGRYDAAALFQTARFFGAREQEAVLGVEAAQDGFERDAGAIGHLLERDLVIRRFVKELERGVEDSQSGGLGRLGSRGHAVGPLARSCHHNLMTV
jgi:hypothetical protein